MTRPAGEAGGQGDGTSSGADLAGVGHWDDVWRLATDRPLSLCSYCNYRLNEVFARHLTLGCRMFEIGAGGSRWLPFLGQRYGCEVHGIDYSTQGVRLAEALLRRAGVRGSVQFGDVFDANAELVGQFDLVWSAGFIEHFKDTPGTISSLARYLAPGGTMITLVPNVRGAIGALHRLVDREVYAMHEAIDPARMDAAHGAAGLEPIERAAYFGVFSLGVVNFNRVRRRLPSFVDRLFWGTVLGAQQTVCLPCRLLRVRPETRLFSPYIVGVYRRRTSPG